MAWVEKTKSGLRYVDRFEIDGKLKKISTPIERDTPQAKKAALKRLQEKVKIKERPIMEKSFHDVVEAYLSRSEIRESTRYSISSAFRGLEEILGNPRFYDLKAKTIRGKMIESNLSNKNLNNKMKQLKALCRWAFSIGWIEEDITNGLLPFPVSDDEKEQKVEYLEHEELNYLLDHLSAMYKYVVHFLALSGMRIGELSALTVDDIDEKYIHITKSYSFLTGQVTKPKNASSTRNVFILPELKKLLKEYKEWRLLYMMSRGIRTDLLFFTRTGGRMEEKRVFDALQRVNKDYHPHLLRHTYVAILAEQGIPLEVIARQLGHKGTETTKKVYYHVTKKQREKDEMMLSMVKIM